MNSWSKKTAWLEKILCGICAVLIGLAVLFLLQQSLFLTTQDDFSVGQSTMKPFYTADSPWMHLLATLLLGAAAVWLSRHPLGEKAGRWIGPAAFCGTIALVLWVILSCRMCSIGDGGNVLDAAIDLMQGNFDAIAPGSYVNDFPFQSWLVLYDTVFVWLFGQEGAVLALQIAGLLWVGGAALLLAKSCALLFHRKTTGWMLVLGTFLPIYLNVTMFYGNQPGLFFAALQIYGFALLVNRESRLPDLSLRTRVLLLMLIGFSGGIAVLFKQNYAIFSIAVYILLVWRWISSRRGWFLIAITATLLVYLLGSQAAIRTVYGPSGYQPSEGWPSEEWLQIGLRDQNAAEGWFDIEGYGVESSIFHQEGRAALQVYCRQQLSKRIAELTADPAGALRFFARKINSGWNMPTFQSLKSSRNRTTRPAVPALINSFLGSGGKLNRIYTLLSNLMLTQLWVWTLVWLIISRKELTLEKLLLGITFLGGFLFHTLWEMQAINLVMYVFLMLPYAWQGLHLFGAGCAARPLHADRVGLGLAGLAAVALLFSGVTGEYFSSARSEAVQRLAEYQAWSDSINLNSYAELEKTVTILHRDSGRSLSLDYTGQSLIFTPEINYSFSLVYAPCHQPLSDMPKVFRSWNMICNDRYIGMNMFEGVSFPGSKGTVGVDASGYNCQWEFRSVGPGEYLLVVIPNALHDNKEYALAARGDRPIFEPLTGESDQVWIVYGFGE